MAFFWLYFETTFVVSPYGLC